MSAPRRTAVLAGLAGIALLVVGFLPWFEDREGASVDLWQSFQVIDIIATAAITLAVATAAAALAGDRTGLPVAGSSVTVAAAAITCVLLLYRLVNPPDALAREIGAWLGPALTAAIGLLAYQGMREEPAARRRSEAPHART